MESRLKVFPKRLQQVNHFNRIVESRLLSLEETTTAFDKKLYRLINGVDKLPPVSPTSEDKEPYMKPELNFQLSKGLEKPKILAPDAKPVFKSHQIDVFIGEPEVQEAESFRRWETDSSMPEEVDVDDPAIASETTSERSSKLRDERRLAEEMAKLKNTRFPDRIQINAQEMTCLFREYLTNNRTRNNIVLRPFKPLIHNQKGIRAIMAKVLAALTGIVKRHAQKEGRIAKDIEVSDKEPRARQMHKTIKERDASSKTSELAPMTKESSTPDAITTEQWNTVLRQLGLFDDSRGYHGANMRGWPTITEVRKSFACIDNLFDNYLMPGHAHFRERTATTVRFCDLWHVFQTGDFVVTKPSTVLDETGAQDQLGMRVLLTTGGRRAILPHLPAPAFQSSVALGGSLDKVEVVNGVNPFCIHAYYLDFNGSRFVPVRQRFVISPYPGEKDIRDLEVIPFEYDHNAARMLTARGEKFFASVTARTAPYVDCKGLELSTREELNDKVIVDMKGYFQMNPNDIPKFQRPETLDISETSDCYQGGPFCSWGSITCDHRNPIVYDQMSDLAVYKEYVNKKPVFNPPSATADALGIDDEDLGICHYRVFAYKLRSREWGRSSFVNRIDLC